MILSLSFPLPPSTLVDLSYAARLIGVSENTLYSWRDEHRGPRPSYSDGQMYYRLDELQRWAVVSDVERFVRFAERYRTFVPVDLDDNTLPVPPLNIDEFIDDLNRLVDDERVPPAPPPPPAPRVKRPYHRRAVATAPPEPEVMQRRSPATPPPEPVSVMDMGPSRAIPAVLETTHPQPMKFRDLLDYLKVGGYQGSLSAIGPAIQELKQRGILKLTPEGWTLNR